MDYEEVGNDVQPQARGPQCDAVEFVRDQYAGINPNHSVYNSDA